MVEVGVGQQDRVQVFRIKGKWDPVADRLIWAALEHAAVDEDPSPVRDQQVLGPGDGRRTTEEVDLHGRHGDRAEART